MEKKTKEMGLEKNIRSHIETHMQGLSYSCKQCDKICRSSNALNMHIFSASLTDYPQDLYNNWGLLPDQLQAWFYLMLFL